MKNFTVINFTRAMHMELGSSTECLPVKLFLLLQNPPRIFHAGKCDSAYSNFFPVRLTRTTTYRNKRSHEPHIILFLAASLHCSFFSLPLITHYRVRSMTITVGRLNKGSPRNITKLAVINLRSQHCATAPAGFRL